VFEENRPNQGSHTLHGTHICSSTVVLAGDVLESVYHVKFQLLRLYLDYEILHTDLSQPSRSFSSRLTTSGSKTVPSLFNISFYSRPALIESETCAPRIQTPPVCLHCMAHIGVCHSSSRHRGERMILYQLQASRI
jgi:hypothetical protein